MTTALSTLITDVAPRFLNLSMLLLIVVVLPVISRPAAMGDPMENNTILEEGNIERETAQSEAEPQPTITERCPSDDQEFVSPINGSPRCCKKCPPGTGMLQLCTNDTDTVCRPCKLGSEYSSESSATAKCQQCKECQEMHPFAVVRTHCSATEDTTCRCLPGFYFSEATSSCRACTKCPAGSGAERACSWDADTVCQPCKKGTWSSTESSVDACQPCTVCKPVYLEMRQCSSTQNSLCCPLHNANCEETILDVDNPDNPPESQAVDNPQKPSEDYPMITVYCSLLGLIIITLLLYIVYKLWQQHLVSGDFKVASNETSRSQRLFEGFTGCNKLHKAAEISRAHTDQSGETISEKDGLLVDDSSMSNCNNERPASSLSSYVISRLAEELAQNGRWKSIGGQLGFTEENLHEFEVAATAASATDAELGKRKDPPDVNAAYHMLTTWVSRPDSKIGTLQQTVCQSLAAGGDTSLCSLFDPTFCPPVGRLPGESVVDGQRPPAYSPADVPM
ncbi:hypothetical protein AAHC03_05129 [Spirometra sp. Aus1]